MFGVRTRPGCTPREAFLAGHELGEADERESLRHAILGHLPMAEKAPHLSPGDRAGRLRGLRAALDALDRRPGACVADVYRDGAGAWRCLFGGYSAGAFTAPLPVPPGATEAEAWDFARRNVRELMPLAARCEWS